MRQTVLFLHGAPGRAADWDAVCALAPSATRCVALSLPDNEADLAGTRLAELESCVAAALDAAGGDPVTLVGHSLGGWLATRVAAAPGVQRLVLVGATEHYREPLLGSVRGMVETLTGAPAALPAVAEAIAASWFPAAAMAHPARAATARFLGALPPARLARVGARILETTTRPALAAWSTPTTLVHAEADEAIPFTWAEALAARLPHARLLRAPAAGHVPHLLTPELVARAVFADPQQR